ncbi:MAG: hypothetical protein J7483_11080 [Novosphingobium sp.]|nr:hypothetical protein [Novosphingobium sp.]
MLYQNGDISVDAHFARVGSKSYAIDKISSVDVRQRKPHTLGPVLLFGLLALLFAWFGRLSMDVGAGMPFFVVAGVCALVAWHAIRKLKVVEYRLFLVTSATEVQAIETRDAEAIAELRAAIETAISRTRHHRMDVHFMSAEPAAPQPEPIELRPAASGSSLRQRLIGGA